MDDAVVAGLVELGLTRNEALAWLTLLDEGDPRGLTGYEVAGRSGIPRSAVYAVLRRLEQSGGAFRTEEEPARYAAVPPSRLLEGLRGEHARRASRLEEALSRMPARSRSEPLWTLSRYDDVLERARAMIAAARQSLALSLWRRELDALRPALHEAASSRGVFVLLHCVDPPGPPLDGVAAWSDPAMAQDEAKQGWSHKIIAVADRAEVLVGGAEPGLDCHAVWTRNPSLVDVCTDHVILDVTLLATRRGVDPRGAVAPLMRPHLPAPSPPPRPGSPLAVTLALPLLAAAGLLPACQPQCVGPSCAADDDTSGADDDSAAGDDDASAGGDDDDDDATPSLPGWEGDEPLPPIVSRRDCSVRVQHLPPGSPASVEVAGEFSGWQPLPMDGPAEDGSWSLDLGELSPGSYAYKYLHDGSWEGAPPAWAFAKWVDGIENRALYVGDCKLPELRTISASTSPDGSLSAQVRFARADDDSPLDPDSLQATVADVGGGSVLVEADPDSGLISIEAIGLLPGKHSVSLRARDEEGRDAENAPLWVPLWVEDEPFLWQDALLYFAFVDRFRNGDYDQTQPYGPVDGVETRANFQGGDWLGVVHALEDGWFEDLGVGALWLSPVLDNPQGAYIAADGVHQFSGFHGYWPLHPRDIEEHYADTGAGSEERLKELVAEAHARGIRVVLDLVLNHVHEQHLYVAQHPEWFGGGCVCGTDGCGWDEHAVDCWFMPYLPDLDFKNPFLLERVVDDTLALVRDLDADGVRVDAAKHMDHVIMRTLRKRLMLDFERNGGAPFHLVGETFTGTDGAGLVMDYVSPYELDGQFDFPLYWPIRDGFAHGGSFVTLEAQVAADAEAYGDAVMSPFLGNHDVVRFATDAAGNGGGPWGETEDLLAGGGDSLTQGWLVDRLSMAFAFVLTQPGMPLIYYGDEIGLAGDGDPDNRRMMGFPPYLSENQEQLLSRVRAVGQARQQSAALRRGARVQLWVDDTLLVYARTDGDEVAVVAMNKGDAARSESVPAGGLGLDGVELLDARGGGRSVTGADGELAISLGAWDWALFVE
jgi:glycosidase/sugar-specific transcriptional regulator TrmB